MNVISAVAAAVAVLLFGVDLVTLSEHPSSVPSKQELALLAVFAHVITFI